jgi:hypothetical protein
MEQKAQLLIKHAVGGRTFIDSVKEGLPFSVEPFQGGWKISVTVLRDERIQEIFRLKEELNVFVFVNTPDRGMKKTWYYVQDGNVDYDESRGQLVIHARSRIEYYPADFSYS